MIIINAAKLTVMIIQFYEIVKKTVVCFINICVTKHCVPCDPVCNPLQCEKMNNLVVDTGKFHRVKPTFQK